MAETFIGAMCPRVSMAPVLAITGMVAGTAHRESFDPVGEISKPFVTGPNPIPKIREVVKDGNGQEVASKSQGEERTGAKVAIRRSGSRGNASGGSGDRCG
jgi:hypothetical protein